MEGRLGGSKGRLGEDNREGGNGGGNGEGDWGVGNREAETGRWRRGKRREDFTDGYDGMPGWVIGLINGSNQIESLGRQGLLQSLIATSTWNAWVE